MKNLRDISAVPALEPPDESSPKPSRARPLSRASTGLGQPQPARSEGRAVELIAEQHRHCEHWDARSDKPMNEVCGDCAAVPLTAALAEIDRLKAENERLREAHASDLQDIDEQLTAAGAPSHDALGKYALGPEDLSPEGVTEAKALVARAALAKGKQ